MLHDVSGGHAQGHCGVHQPGPVQVDADSVAVGQEAHLGARCRRRSEEPGLGEAQREAGAPGHRAWLLWGQESRAVTS